MRDVNMGWAIRYTHANTASFFFIFVYLHIGRGLYYGSYRSPRVLPWSIGVVILVLMMATDTIKWPNWNTIYLEILNSAFHNLDFILDGFQLYMSALLPLGGPRTRSLKRIGPHNLDVISILVSGILGDWWGHSIKGLIIPSVRFQIEQSKANIAYINFLSKFLFDLGYCASNNPKLVAKQHKIKGTGKTFDQSKTIITYNYRLTLFSFTSLYWIYSDFYIRENGVLIKKIPIWIGDYMTPISLAHWIMQDGSRQKGQGVMLATNSFTYD